MTWSTAISAFTSLALALLACAPVPCTPVALDTVPAIVDTTIALVADTADGGTVPICSGVWVDERHIATAGHCAEALARIKAGVDEDGPDLDPIGVVVQYATRGETRGYHEAPTTRHNAQVVGYDGPHDVAILAATLDAPAHRVAVMAPPPPLGAPLHLIGHAKGYCWTYQRGYASTVWGSLPGVEKDGPFFQVSGPVTNGMSGSGAWDERGRFVGLLSFYANQVPSTGFYVLSTTVAKVLASSTGTR